MSNFLMKFLLNIIVVIAAVAITSCGQKNESLLTYTNGRQHLTLNELTIDGKPLVKPTIHVNVPDTISITEKIYAEIYLDRGNYQLLAAYYDCKTVENPTVDTVRTPRDYTKRIDGCKLELLVENDTVKIGWKSPNTGPKTFKDITLLTLDNDGVFRTHTINFDYFVTD